MSLVLDHVGIAVSNLEESAEIFREILHVPYHLEEMARDRVRVAIFALPGTRVELIEPTSPESPVAVFLKKKGGGLHHLAFQVKDLGEFLSRMREKGMSLADEAPRKGAGGKQIAFLHPRSTCGVLLEFTEGESCGAPFTEGESCGAPSVEDQRKEGKSYG